MLLVCVLLTLLIYNPAGLYFLCDDLVHIPLSEKGELFQHNSLRPVHDLLLHLDVYLWGHNPYGYHLVKLIIHLLCAGVFYVFAVLFFGRYAGLQKEAGKQAALLSTSFFLLYAFHSESVLWILAGGSSLCAFFFLISVICYIKKQDNRLFFLLSLASFFIGLLTYESIWVSPLVIVLISWAETTLRGASIKKEIPYALAYVAVFIVHLILRFKILGELYNTYDTSNITGDNLGVLILNFNRLLGRCFLPPMASSYLFAGLYVLGFLFLIWLIKKFWRNQKDMVFFILFTCLLASLIPVISLGINTHTTESERYLYLPSIFVCLLTVYMLFKWFIPAAIKRDIFVLILLAHIFWSYSSSRDYRVASSMEKSALEGINNSKCKQMYLYNMPSQFRGVPVFRLGLMEGLSWLYQTDTTTIHVAEKNKIIPANKYFLQLAKFDYPFHVSVVNKGDSCVMHFVYDETTFSEQ